MEFCSDGFFNQLTNDQRIGSSDDIGFFLFDIRLLIVRQTQEPLDIIG